MLDQRRSQTLDFGWCLSIASVAVAAARYRTLVAFFSFLSFALFPAVVQWANGLVALCHGGWFVSNSSSS
jgi:hypothetical protein